MNKKKKKKSFLRKVVLFFWNSESMQELKKVVLFFLMYCFEQFNLWYKPKYFIYKMYKFAWKKRLYLFFSKWWVFLFYGYKYFSSVFFFSRSSRRSFFLFFELRLMTLSKILNFVDCLSMVFYNLYLIYWWWSWQFIWKGVKIKFKYWRVYLKGMVNVIFHIILAMYLLLR